MVKKVKEVFISRDDDSLETATIREEQLGNDVMDAIGAGASYYEIESMMADEGLEMDYIEQFI